MPESNKEIPQGPFPRGSPESREGETGGGGGEGGEGGERERDYEWFIKKPVLLKLQYA